MRKLTSKAAARAAKLLVSKLAFFASIVIAFGMFPIASSAAVILTVTDQGTPYDSLIPGIAVGYTAYYLTLTADPGQVITSVTASPSQGQDFGIYGNLLQDFTPSGSRMGAPAATPNETATNNSNTGFSLDSHFITVGGVQIVTPSEDSNNINPGRGVPPDDQYDAFGTGTMLTGTYGLNPPAAVVPLAYLVVPSYSYVSYDIQVEEFNPQGPLAFFYTFDSTIPPQPGVPEPATSVEILLSALLMIRCRLQPRPLPATTAFRLAGVGHIILGGRASIRGL